MPGDACDKRGALSAQEPRRHIPGSECPGEREACAAGSEGQPVGSTQRHSLPAIGPDRIPQRRADGSPDCAADEATSKRPAIPLHVTQVKEIGCPTGLGLARCDAAQDESSDHPESRTDESTFTDRSLLTPADLEPHDGASRYGHGCRAPGGLHPERVRVLANERPRHAL